MNLSKKAHQIIARTMLLFLPILDSLLIIGTNEKFIIGLFEVRKEWLFMSGYIYIISSEHEPDMLKIGLTTQNPNERLRQLNSTGVAHLLYLRATFPVYDTRRSESLVHERLANNRFRSDREFFKISLAEAIPIIEETLIKHGQLIQEEEFVKPKNQKTRKRVAWFCIVFGILGPISGFSSTESFNEFASSLIVGLFLFILGSTLLGWHKKVYSAIRARYMNNKNTDTNSEHGSIFTQDYDRSDTLFLSGEEDD